MKLYVCRGAGCKFSTPDDIKAEEHTFADNGCTSYSLNIREVAE